MVSLIQKTCKLCKGGGEVSCRQVCLFCNGSTCYRCESKGPIKLYKTCDTCWGYGALYFDSQTGKQHFLFATKQFSIECSSSHISDLKQATTKQSTKQSTKQ